MLLLEFHNRIILNTLQTRYAQAQAGSKIDAVDITIADFDGVMYHVHNPEGVREKIQVSIKLHFFHELQDHGIDDVIKAQYGPYLQSPESGHDITLLYDLTSISGDADAVFFTCAMLRRNCFGAVFEKMFEHQKNGGNSGPPAVIHYREGESMLLQAFKDRVTVVFSTLFQDDDDIVIGKVFLQEFKEGRKGNMQAPQVLFSHRDPPTELAGTNAATGQNVGYITFVLEPRHISDPNKTIDLIHTFRDYLHYHIKCSKAYLHSRMRTRCATLLKILNRARPDTENKAKKTASGKSFSR